MSRTGSTVESERHSSKAEELMEVPICTDDDRLKQASIHAMLAIAAQLREITETLNVIRDEMP